MARNGLSQAVRGRNLRWGMSLTWTSMVLVAVLFASPAFALSVSTRYRSPRNPERKVRQTTELIVLHTTEAPAPGSLNKLSERGEAHYCVTEEGRVYQIVDRDLEAFHAGRSMWKGKEDVDKFSIGIECVGYHDKAMPMVQLVAIRDLVKELKQKYRIPDERVVCHSHVAYGSPNRWHKRRNRGRKRCGMLFAMPSVRRILELKYRPAFDADTRAGRLAVGDDYLNRVLYGSVDTMAANYARGATVEPEPQSSSGRWFRSLFGIKPKEKPVVVVPAPPQPKPQPKKTVQAKVTPKPQPLKPRSSVKRSTSASARGTDEPKSIAQLKARGYVLKGSISASNTASKIAGSKWNAPDTYYTIRDKVVPGSSIDATHIEKGVCVWMKK